MHARKRWKETNRVLVDMEMLTVSPSDEGVSRSSAGESVRSAVEKPTAAFRRRKKSNWSPEACVGGVEGE